MAILLRILRYMRPYWRVAVVSYVCLTAASGMMLLGPWLIGKAIDLATGAQDTFPLLPAGWSQGRTLTGAAVIIVGLALARAGINFGQRYGTQWLGRKIAYAIRLDLFTHLQRLPFAYYDHARTGQLMSRLIGDVDEIRFFAGIVIGDAINLIVLLVGIYGTMFSINAPLTAVFLIPVPVLFIIAYQFGIRVEPRIRQIRSLRGELYARIQENLSQIMVVKAFVREPYARDRFEEDNDKVLAAWLHFAHLWTLAQPIIWALVGMMTFVLLFFGGRLVLSGELSLGTLVAFNGYVGLLSLPANRLAFMIDVTARAVANGKRIFAIMDTTPEIRTRPGAVNPGTFRGHIVFDRVSFVYAPREDEREVEVLYDISFEAQPNTVTAIVGTTGSGKTTLIDLIPRFYDVTGGTIRIDGHDVRDLPLKLLRSQVGIVMQTTFLFNATVAENIAFGRPAASHDEIVAAAKAARAHGFILDLPDGYATMVGERGVTLSGGQRQRIAIARALLVDPRILILDDATASVDSRTEYEIRAALQTLMRGRTTLIVAQRLSTVRHADQILMLDGGRIVERGTHDELIRQGGRYARLWRLQTDQEPPPEDIRGIGRDGEEIAVEVPPPSVADQPPDPADEWPAVRATEGRKEGRR